MRKSMNNQRRFPSLFVATLLISLLGAAGCDYVIYMGEPTENECEPECAENQVCKNGKCEPTTDVNVCALECPDGFKCVDNECVCAYSSHIKCSDACVDLQVDKSNCGKCGNQCDVYCSLGCCDGLQRCGGSDDPCVDLMTDSKNCGGCGIVCNENTQRCANGNCVLETKCESDSDCSQEHQICDTNTNYCICEKGYEVCNDTGVCIDLSDPKTCGSCANDCYTEGVKEARCEDRENDKVCVAVQCEDSYRKCDDACVYIYTNKDHCGSCNNPCLGLNVCMDGTCTSCNDAENPNPCDRVTSKCTNFSTDPKNCNGCGDEFECGMNQNCEGGECKCINTSEVSCGKGCFSDTQTNTERCGPNCLNCNELPGVETATCSEGVCFIYTCKTSLHYQQNTRDDKCICAEGYTECDEHCVDTNTDTKNCGVCGTDCDANKPENAVMACENGTCVVKSCENGQELCDGICLDASSDKNHCGMCNNICGENQKCEQGVCTCIDQEVEYRACELKYNDRSFYICLGQNADCDEFEQTTGDNYVCLNDKCICVGDDEGKTVCESKNNTNANSGVKVCVDTKNDSQYCGACDKACDDDEICKEGKCEKNPCASNSKTPYYCSGECFDIKTDINNCGNCGNKCIVDGVIEAVCENGVCKATKCNSDYIGDNKPCNDACPKLSADPYNCSSCGYSCYKSGVSEAKCVNGGCQIVSCDSELHFKENPENGSCVCAEGYTSCKEGENDIVCVDTNNDLQHCGKCGTKCGKKQVCLNGECEPICEFDNNTLELEGNGTNTTMQSCVLEPGEYKLEVWGAQGGEDTPASSSRGGKGGYSVGSLYLNENTKVFMHAGGHGVKCEEKNTTGSCGGYNGGGNANYFTNGVKTYHGHGGGGASDIRLLEDNLEHRVIVAGGGGGADDAIGSGSGGHGGGINGGDGECNGKAKGASQTGDSWGIGEDAGKQNDIGGGGGGWYGGKASQDRESNCGGGGGSGYVLTKDSVKPEGYKLGLDYGDKYYLSEAKTTGGDKDIPKTNGSGEEIGHSGNGYVRITKL